MKCILLCAGYATRLFPITENFPKHLLEIKEGKTILDYNLEQVNTIEEVDAVYIVTNHRYYEHFVKWQQDHLDNPKPITVLDDGTTSNDDRLGAIGDMQFVINEMNIDDDILVIAADNLYDYALKGVIDFYKEKKAPTLVADQLCDDYEYLKQFAIATLSSDGKVLELAEKPEQPATNIRVWATYVYPREMLKEIKTYLKEGNNPDSPGRLPAYLYKKIPFYAYCFTDGVCYDVGTHGALKEVRELFQTKK